jgi:hypothetical protein
VEGYPPLPDDLRTTVRDGEWTFPADLPLSELERRLEERLRNDRDLAEVAVSIDDRGRATVDAAPPLGALSRRVPQGKRAVSVDALVPTGLARRDEVTVSTPDGEVEGTVLSAQSGEGEASIPTAPSATLLLRARTPPTREQVATPRAFARPLLRRGRLAVTAG